jgi:ABC-type glycerol-3-phosphate transport system substrate-binding protein
VAWVKRSIIGLLLIGIAIVLIFGPRSHTPDVQGRVVVQYWEKWTGNEAEQMQQIVDGFNNSVGREKGIYVQYLSMSNITQKTLVATAAGVPPDVAGLWEAQVAQFADLDALQPLDDLAREHGITAGYYKPVYWKGCSFNGRLYALISTPMSMAMLYNKQLFIEHGLDPDKPPRTLAELDEIAQKLDVIVKENGKRTIKSSGYLPMEPGWYVTHTGRWFGVPVFDEATGKLQLNHPKMVEALTWIQSYSRRLGVDTMGEFRSGFGQFNSTQNPFLTGNVAMVQQGPWMANYIEDLKPSMNRWKRSKEEERKLPHNQRQQNYQWGAAAFPSAVPGLEDVSFCGFDMLCIPRGAKHKREAFEFIAYVNRQDVMEKLCSLHCKNSPLATVSRQFIENHPNPYIEVFDRLADSPNAFTVPPLPIWPQVGDELSNAIQRVYLLSASPQEALDDAQARCQVMYDRYLASRQRRRELCHN